MKFTKNILWLLAILLVIVGCSSNDNGDDGKKEETKGDVQAGGELKIAYSAQPSTIDPHMTTAVATSDIMRGVYETLITIDENHEFQPMLAEDYEVSEDGKIITFKLREGVKFHNGKEMTSEDVVASMKRWQELSSSGQAQFADATFSEVDDYTVELSLPSPLSTALSVLSGNLGAFPAIVPKEAVESAGDTGLTEHIGTGPFKYEAWTQDVSIQLTKFDDYQALDTEASGLAGKKEAMVDDVYFYFVPDSSTRVAGMLSGEYDMAHGIPYDNVEQLDSSGTVDINVIPGSTMILTFNKKEGIFKDLKARQAVEAALNLDDIINSTFPDKDYYRISHNLVMPYLDEVFYSKNGEETHNQNDIEKGKQLIEEAGLTGEEITFLATRDYDEMYNASVVTQERLEQIGLKVNLEVLDWPTFLDAKTDETKFDMNIVGFGPQPEPTSYLFVDKGSHSGWMDDDAFHDLVKEFRSQPTLEDTQDTYDKMMKWIEEEVPFIKIADYNRANASQQTLSNVQFLDGFITWNIGKTK